MSGSKDLHPGLPHRLEQVGRRRQAWRVLVAQSMCTMQGQQPQPGSVQVSMTLLSLA